MLQLLNPLKIGQKVTAPTPEQSPIQRVQAMKFGYGNGDRPLPGYSIKRGVGAGGFGEVYFAINDAGKEVALKRIQRNLDVEVRGVRQCLNLKHPNLISLYDIQFDDQEQGWIVMEYVSGPSLREVIERNPTGMQPDELARWFGQIAAAVAYLHDHGIVHRDLKPANIYEDEGIVKIGDYGLSKYISCSRRGGQTESVGTFHYMAPEIGKGEYGKEIDIYALGILLYEMATGTVPFDGESSQEIIMKHLTADPDLSRVDTAVGEVVGQALQKSPAARQRDVREMLGPLNMRVDDRYMLVQLQESSLPPVVSHAAGPQPAFAKSPVPPAAYSPKQPADQRAQHPGAIGPMKLRYDEPIAYGIRSTWGRLSDWWASLQLNPGARAAILAVVIIFCVLQSGMLLSMLVMGLMLYVPYYIVWWFVIRSSPTPTIGPGQPLARQASPGHQKVAACAPVVQRPVAIVPPSPARPIAPKPLSLRQWKAAKRRQLSLTSRAAVLSEVTGSWMGSTGVLAVFSTLATVFLMGSGRVGQPFLIGVLWTALVSLVCAWTMIALGKRWQKSEGDWAVRSFIQLTCGLAIGTAAFGLSEFLMIVWPGITEQKYGDLPVHRWSGFFTPDGQPLIPAYLAYFPLLMGFVHWWKQVDPLRRTRFSFLAVIWSIIAAGIVHLLIPFPQPWGALVAAGTSIAIQLACPWTDPDERRTLYAEKEVV